MDSDEANLTESTSHLNVDTVAGDDNYNVTASKNKIWTRPQHQEYSGCVHPIIGVPSRMKIRETPHMKNNFSLVTVFVFFFMGMIHSNRWWQPNYNQNADTLDSDDQCS
jgi:hypothetical protein